MNDEIEKIDTENKSEQAGQPEQTDQKENIEETEENIPQWVSDLDSYPLREKDKDPKWAVRTVWIWIGFALTCLTGILLLLVLGAIYD